MSEPANDRLRQLFDAAFELAQPERGAFLDRECGSDAALRARLQAMLDGADADDFLAAPGTLADREGVGATIGPYRLVEQIGEGGFGVVFRAEQQQPVARTVALKIVKLGMDTREVVARFEQERQALARMDHPHIAKVLDAGATASGRPYFVMELVPGEPVVRYCDRHRLDVRERLTLFGQVCRAVQHAHGKGIIHRDLKPSNVLVATHDGKPVAKVIDFGVAKATSGTRTDATLWTGLHQVVGTLQYMSPEQAAGSPDLDTRTDVYALGVLLYELLTGTTPFPRARLDGAMLAEVQRLIQEQDPPRPSTAITEAAAVATAVARDRRTEPRRLGLQLRGDLDWIVMKSLEKDRHRRYETVDGLAADIERHLAGDAVLAAPPSAIYRVRKLVRRHRALFVGTGAVLATLVAGVIAFAWQARIAARERDTAVLAQQAEARLRAEADRLAQAESEQRRIAEQNGARAGAINRFLLDMLGAADVRDLGRDVKVAQVLDRVAGDVGRRFADDPAVQGEIRSALARAYLSLGLIEPAGVQLDAGLEVVRSVHGAESVEFAQLLGSRAEWLRQKGDAAAAVEASRQAHRIVVQAQGATSRAALREQLELGNALNKAGQRAEAEPLLRDALDELLQVAGPDDRDTTVARNSLAVLLHSLGQLDEAEALYREAVAAGERALGDDHVDTLTARMNLGAVLRARGQEALARPMLEATFERLVKVHGDAHVTTAEAAWNLALLHYDAGRYPLALPLLEQCIAIRTRAQGAATPGVAKAQEVLGHCAIKLGDRARAVAAFEAAIATRTASFGADADTTLRTRLHLGNALLGGDRRADGEAMLRDVLAACERALGPDAATTLIATNSLAVAMLDQERPADAVPFLERALAGGRRAPNVDPRDTAITQLNLVGALRDLGRLAEAETLGREALATVRRLFGAGHPTTAAAHGSLGATLLAQKRPADALPEYDEAARIRRAATGDANPTFGGDALVAARLRIDAGALDEAAAAVRDVAAVYTQARGEGHRVVLAARAEAARVEWRAGRHAAAEPGLLAAEAALAALQPPAPRDLQRVRGYLAAFYAAWHAVEPDPARAEQAAAWQAKAGGSR